MMDGSELKNWRSLVEAVRQLQTCTPAAPATSDAIGHARDLYNTCLQKLLDKNDEDFYVAAYKIPGTLGGDPNDPAMIDLHFPRYQTDSTITALLSLFDLSRIEEESNGDAYQAIFRRQLNICAEEIRAYADRIGNEGITISQVFKVTARRPKASNSAVGSGTAATAPVRVSLTDKATIDRLSPAVSKLAVLKEASAQILASAKEADNAARAKHAHDQQSAPAGTVVAVPDPTLEPDEAERLERQRATFERILEYVGEAKRHLFDLADALLDQQLHQKISNYLSPLADYYEEQARKPFRALPKIGWLTVAAVSGCGLLAYLAAALWPTFGPPSAFALALAAVIAFAVGFYLWEGRDSDTRATTEKERMQSYISGILRVRPGQTIQVRGRTLSLLEERFRVAADDTKPAPAAPTPMQRVLGALLLQPPKQRPWRDPKTGRVESIEFDNVGRVGAEPGAHFWAFVSCFLLAAVGSLAPLGASLGARAVSSASSEAQIIQQTAGRETCQVARGHVIWQAGNEIYLASGAGITAINRDQVTQIRYSSADDAIQPCKTQGEFYGAHDIKVMPSETKIFPVAIPAPSGNDPSVVVATVPIEMTLPSTPSAPARTILQLFSSVFIEGAPVPIAVPDPARFSYVILPVFTNEVKQEDTGTLNPNSPAYAEIISHFGECKSDLLVTDVSPIDCRPKPNGDVKLTAAIEPIKEALATQRKLGCNIAIDVLGFASGQQFDGADGPTNDQLNWHLAEGRRLAVLVALGFDPVAGDFKQDEATGKLELISRPAGETVSFDGLKLSERFGSPEDMSETLKLWLHQPEVIERKKLNGFEEALRRSVVIAISNEDLSGCRTQAQDAPGPTKVSLPG